MSVKILIQLIVCALCSLSLCAKDTVSKVKIRALLHDPLKPFAELYVQGEAAKMERLNLAMEGLTVPQTVVIAKETLSVYSSATINPEKPLEKLMGTTTIHEGVKQAIVLIVPASKSDKLPYNLRVINDSFAAFPKGESRVINMTRQPLAIRAGEHSKEVAAADIVAIPPVTKVNAMNQAQTIFYKKIGGEWELISERPTQFTGSIRNIFLLYQLPNIDEPQVRTVIDPTSS